MIVCLCNALSDARIGHAIAAGARRPREVHAACACRAQCGRCVHAMLELLRAPPATADAVASAN